MNADDPTAHGSSSQTQRRPLAPSLSPAGSGGEGARRAGEGNAAQTESNRGDASTGEDLAQALPVDGVLDLHTFRPKDVKNVVADYLQACSERGIREVRVIHGKGIGNLRRTVHAFLATCPLVESFADASALYGGLGATMVRLRAKAG